MDPVSVTSGIFGLVAVAQTVAVSLFNLKETLHSTKAAEEVHFYTLLLSELSDLVLKNAEVPPSALAAAKLCQERLTDLQHAVTAKNPDAKVIRAELSSFQASIMLLRQMVMDSITHTLLQEQREAQVQALESDLSRRAKYSGSIQVNMDPDAFASENAVEKLQKMLSTYSNPNVDHDGSLQINITRDPEEREDSSERDADIDQLRSQLQKTHLQAQAGKNPFQRAIHIRQADPSRGHLPFIAKIDTASRKNWVRPEVVQRLALEHQVEQLPAHESGWFKGAGGEEFQANGRVTLTWYDSIVARTRETGFLVSGEGAPFDLIFGWEWLTADGESAFAEPFLVIMKEMKLSEAENRQMQANLISQTQDSEKLASMRHAEASNKREAKRHQKALNASRAASRAASVAQTPSFSSIQSPRRSSSPAASPGAPDPQQSVRRDDSSDQRQPSRD